MDKVRVRFAPSPTGIMHLGNVRSALMNYLFAKRYNGTFVLRIEDTDFKRNVENLSDKIIDDLLWLGLEYNEGPVKGGSYGPYYQSQRANFYTQYLNKLIEKNLAYRCFCTPEELEQKRQRQVAMKLPPRYDRTCLNLSQDDIDKYVETNKPFIWRFKLDYSKTVKFYDLAHKEMSFELKHFSDIPLTRQDGSFTFLFANFVDDHLMEITHVFRGEDHLSNTASQVALYEAFNVKLPIFWHLPIIGNKEGKKLSKRDFGFSLTDLQNAGYLPEAISNYLTIIGGSFKKEILNKEELINAIDFEKIEPTGMIKYDVEKLNWVNHKWISNYDTTKLIELCLPYLINKYPQVQDITREELSKLIDTVKTELVTLEQIVNLTEFYFNEPNLDLELIKDLDIDINFFSKLILDLKDKLNNPEQAVDFIKDTIKEQKKPLSVIFKLIRFALTGRTMGPSILELFKILESKKIYKRLDNLIKKLSILQHQD
ncbi:glutamate--tRNA ligase [Candidatus Babela massiliensis]|uniref:Glutamate--tRNA ligase n=1 Tax=Candidatus Babela massiliensis TaxID=673862 RepID=V6DFR4_9BACT|nr:glutamate--tRNA ligase [Candidatus Babela massiliensis]CDK30384.1 Glutamyl-or glutaminyl-tRNA synthetase [Candidatus Babela massiliensis]